MSKSTFWQKQLVCPVCSSEMLAQRVRQGAYEAEKRDPDFCVWYKGVNPVLYSIDVCPSCNYAATPEDFAGLDKRTAQRLQDQFERGSGDDEFSGLMTPDLAVKAHLLAINAYRMIAGSEGKIAGLYLRAAWICRQKDDNDEEMEYLNLSIENYMAAFESSRKLPEKLGEIGVAYLIGECNRRLGNIKEAIKWFNVALSNKSIKTRPDLEKLARGQWQATREGFKEEHKIASQGVPFGKLNLNQDHIKEITGFLHTYSDDIKSVQEFERMFSGRTENKFTFAFSHQAFAFEALLEALQISQSSEVIIPAFSPPDLVSALKRIKAGIRVADVGVESLKVSPGCIKDHISQNTKAIFIARFAGNIIDHKAVMNIAGNIPVVELAFEAVHKKSDEQGSSPVATVFDIAPPVIVSALAGAAISTDDETFAGKLKAYSSSPSATTSDYQLNPLNAKLGLLTIKDIHKSLQKMDALFSAYKVAFDKFVKEGKVKIMSAENSYGCFALRIISEFAVDEIIARAKESHIEIKRLPVPVDTLLETQSDCKNALECYQSVVLLPSYPAMTQMDVERTSAIVLSFLAG